MAFSFGVYVAVRTSWCGYGTCGNEHLTDLYDVGDGDVDGFSVAVLNLCLFVF